MATHGMIDLETLSTWPNAVILSLGAVKFDPYSDADTHDHMYFKVDVDSQSSLHRHVMQDTLDWWAKQPEEIREDALGLTDRVSLEETVRRINKWAVGVDVFWCQGPLFDYAILQNFYAQMDTPVPWQYWQIRDSRTLFSLYAEKDGKREGHHNALADSEHQAKKVQRYYRHLGLKR